MYLLINYIIRICEPTSRVTFTTDSSFEGSINEQQRRWHINAIIVGIHPRNCVSTLGIPTNDTTLWFKRLLINENPRPGLKNDTESGLSNVAHPYHFKKKCEARPLCLDRHTITLFYFSAQRGCENTASKYRSLHYQSRLKPIIVAKSSDSFEKN